MAKSHQKASLVSFPDYYSESENTDSIKCYFFQCKEDRINFLIKCIDSDCHK